MSEAQLGLVSVSVGMLDQPSFPKPDRQDWISRLSGFPDKNSLLGEFYGAQEILLKGTSETSMNIEQAWDATIGLFQTLHPEFEPPAKWALPKEPPKK